MKGEVWMSLRANCREHGRELVLGDYGCGACRSSWWAMVTIPHAIQASVIQLANLVRRQQRPGWLEAMLIDGLVVDDARLAGEDVPAPRSPGRPGTFETGGDYVGARSPGKGEPGK